MPPHHPGESAESLSHLTFNPSKRSSILNGKWQMEMCFNESTLTEIKMEKQMEISATATCKANEEQRKECRPDRETER